jgi:hypothetical protein
LIETNAKHIKVGKWEAIYTSGVRLVMTELYFDWTPITLAEQYSPEAKL